MMTYSCNVRLKILILCVPQNRSKTFKQPSFGKARYGRVGEKIAE